MFAKTKYSLLILAIVLVFSISGVFAVWVYSEGVITPVDTTVGVDLFEWLPGMGTDGNNQNSDINKAGTNHSAVIDAAVGIKGNKKADLNSSNSAVNKTINNLLGDNTAGDINGHDNLQGGAMKNVFPETTENLGLILQFRQLVNGTMQMINNGNTYYMFTFDTVESANGDEWSDKAHVGELAVVWRTALNKVDGVWTRGVSEVGYAPKIVYSGNTLTVDHHLWVKGEIPTT